MQQQQAHQQETALHHELSAEEQKAKAERAAHQADRQKLVEREQQMAAAEHSQAAINERLRLQNERLRAITSQRHETVDAAGHTYIQEPGNRTLVTVNNQTFIRHDETQNFTLYGGNALTHRAPSGNTISTISRPDGGRIEVEVDIYGRPIRRVRFLPDGRRFVLFENRAIAAGIGLAALGAFVVTLPPAQIDIPRDEYIVDASVASEDDIYGALQAPPVAPLDRTYSLDEVLASVSLRERMRSISIDTIHFEFGSAEIGPEQAVMLESVAAAIRDAANANPGEVFLIEGHTDAVGSDVDNLSLSDRRAQTVADVLSQQFGVPRESLVTQGYGKQFLLVPTDGPERRNRRVVVRRITPLLQGEQSRYSGGYGAPEGEAQQ
ncbi:MAG TPA: OmpA family protein [Rhodomicrobium sp.]|nr:OmpA family protein [Rhodomicrobium sp.]